MCSSDLLVPRTSAGSEGTRQRLNAAPRPSPGTAVALRGGTESAQVCRSNRREEGAPGPEKSGNERSGEGYGEDEPREAPQTLTSLGWAEGWD